VAHHAYRWILLEHIEHGGQFILCPPVVGVKEGNDFSVEFRNGGIEGRGLAAIFFANVADARSEFCDQSSGVVRRPVIDLRISSSEGESPCVRTLSIACSMKCS